MKKKVIHPVIVITGLDGAGKSTFLQRIKTGTFVEHITPTIGYEVAMVYKDGIRFDIVDLGGHEVFRTTFWKNFVTTSHGCIFIFDSTDKERLEVAKEWLWNVEGWLSKDASFAFFANKVDKENRMSLEEILDGLELHKFSETPLHSFRIFETSNVTGQNINEAWDWLTGSILRKLEARKLPDIYAFEMYNELMEPVVEVILEDQKRDELQDTINFFRTHSIKLVDELPAIQLGEIIALILRKGDYYAVAYVNRTDNISLAREIAISLFFESLARYRREQPVTKELLQQIISGIEI